MAPARYQPPGENRPAQVRHLNRLWWTGASFGCHQPLIQGGNMPDSHIIHCFVVCPIAIRHTCSSVRVEHAHAGFFEPNVTHTAAFLLTKTQSGNLLCVWNLSCDVLSWFKPHPGIKSGADHLCIPSLQNEPVPERPVVAPLKDASSSLGESLSNVGCHRHDRACF